MGETNYDCYGAKIQSGQPAMHAKGAGIVHKELNKYEDATRCCPLVDVAGMCGQFRQEYTRF